jgi:hypothetical protein
MKAVNDVVSSRHQLLLRKGVLGHLARISSPLRPYWRPFPEV